MARGMIIVILFFAGLPYWIAPASAQTQNLRIITEEFLPYNYAEQDGRVFGISTEIVRAILERIGQSTEIEVLDTASLGKLSDTFGMIVGDISP